MPGGRRPRRQARQTAPGPGAIVAAPQRPLPRAAQQSAITRVRLTLTTPATTTGTGALSLSWSNNPSAATRWTNYAAVFQEYRVLEVKIHYRPVSHYWPQNVVPGNPAPLPGEIISFLSRDTTASLPISKAGAWVFESAKLHYHDSAFVVSCRMMGVNDAVWTNTSLSGASFLIGVYGDQFSTSYTYGVVYVEYLCEFRGAQ